VNPPILIAGAGLAGACAAFELSRSSDRPVHVFEAKTPSSGASGAAAGLVNPFMGRSASPVWRLREALDATHRMLADAGASSLLAGTESTSPGVLRPAVEQDQVEAFRETAAAFPDLTTWLSAEEIASLAEGVQSCGGGLLIPRGGAVDVPALVNALLDAARAHGATVHTRSRVAWWSERPDGTVTVDVEQSAGESEQSASPERTQVDGALLLLCVGQGYTAYPELTNLGLKGIKGQTVTVNRPPGTGPLMPMSGRGYIVPTERDRLILGSSYTHHFDSLDPDPEKTTYILEKTSAMLPGLDAAEVVDVTAGVRVKTNTSNLPIVGALPGRERIWAFTALGSKGLLTAPLIAQSLPAYVADPSRIPDDLRIPHPSPSFAPASPTR
jgi:glycine/D-amino acid oxidase-like deaminating enzyme